MISSHFIRFGGSSTNNSSTEDVKTYGWFSIHKPNFHVGKTISSTSHDWEW
jgi:hypothetical protein